MTRDEAIKQLQKWAAQTSYTFDDLVNLQVFEIEVSGHIDIAETAVLIEDYWTYACKDPYGTEIPFNALHAVSLSPFEIRRINRSNQRLARSWGGKRNCRVGGAEATVKNLVGREVAAKLMDVRARILQEWERRGLKEYKPWVIIVDGQARRYKGAKPFLQAARDLQSPLVEYRYADGKGDLGADTPGSLLEKVCLRGLFRGRV